MQLQGISIADTWQANKATENAGYSVAECYERTTTLCDVGLQNFQEI
jgi:hypothetical protein